MDVRLLKAFAAVVEEKSVSRAAAATGYSQPAVSQQLMALERLLGRRLLDRGPEGVGLTVVGRAIYPHARWIVQMADEMERAAAAAIEPHRHALTARRAA